MTILVAYVPRPEGRAALETGIRIAKERSEKLLVINASPGGAHKDPALVETSESERITRELNGTGLDAEFRQYVRGKDAVEEIEDLVDSTDVTVLVIGLRKRSPVGKLILGSTAQEILLSVSCPVLAVKA